MEKKVTEIGVLEFLQSKYRGYFITKKEIELFSECYEIDVRFDVFHYGIEGLTNEMIMAGKACLDTINNHAIKIELALKNYYDTEVKEMAEEMESSYLAIEDVSQLAQVVEPKELLIRPLKSKIVVGLYFSCSWDEEKGVGIRFDTEGNIIDVGTGEIIY